MAWSTRQLADIAGTTVQAVRHYHRLGLLEEPLRTQNGYKQYGPSHLVRLLQIRRVSRLGVPLRQIDTVRLGGEEAGQVIRELDKELAGTIERLQQVRVELAVVLEEQASLDVPSPFRQVAVHLNERDQALVTLYSHVLEEPQLDDLRQLVSERQGDVDEDEFEALDDDSDDETIAAVGEKLAVMIGGHAERYPWMRDVMAASPHGKEFAESVVVPAITEFYNSAQLKALARAHAILLKSDSPD